MSAIMEYLPGIMGDTACNQCAGYCKRELVSTYSIKLFVKMCYSTEGKQIAELCVSRSIIV
jgi:hypothetical protein